MRTLDPRKGVVGVYDHPAPAGGAVQSVLIPPESGSFVRLGTLGARRLTALRDRIEHALPFDLP